jgi:hypothetical protein
MAEALSTIISLASKLMALILLRLYLQDFERLLAAEDREGRLVLRLSLDGSLYSSAVFDRGKRFVFNWATFVAIRIICARCLGRD